MALVETRHQSSKFHQVGDAQERTPLAHDHLRIGSGEVRPLRGNGADSLVIDLQQ